MIRHLHQLHTQLHSVQFPNICEDQTSETNLLLQKMVKQYQKLFQYSSLEAPLSLLQLMASTSSVRKTLVEQDLITMPIFDWLPLLLSSIHCFHVANSLGLLFHSDLLFGYQDMYTRLARIDLQNFLQPLGIFNGLNVAFYILKTLQCTFLIYYEVCQCLQFPQVCFLQRR